MAKIWMDFNDVDGDTATTLRKFSDKAVHVGDMVTAYDTGVECKAEVIAVNDKVVTLKLKRSTLHTS